MSYPAPEGKNGNLSKRASNLISVILISLFILPDLVWGQTLHWTAIKDGFGELPSGFELFQSKDSIDGAPSIAYYAKINLASRHLHCTTDTSLGRRLSPRTFFEKNNQPLLVVNGTFFDFITQRNLNVVIREGSLVSFNLSGFPLKGKDSGQYIHTTRSAIGIDRKGSVDVAWLFTDSTDRNPSAFQSLPKPWKDVHPTADLKAFEEHYQQSTKRWTMHTAIGGGPVLLQNGAVSIANDAEHMFIGKARHDRHPRTAMGYTAQNELIILAIEGRNKGIAEGASLVHLANILKSLGCIEALNLDGGGSSCMLVNGRETIKPSDKEGQRAVPAVFIVNKR